MKRLVLVVLLLSLFLSAAAAGGAYAEETGEMPLILAEEAEESPAAEPEQWIAKTKNNYDGKVILDNMLCSVKVCDVDLDAVKGWSVTIRCENRAEEPLSFSWENTASAEGKELLIWEETVEVNPGAVKQLSFFSSELTDADELKIEGTVSQNDRNLAVVCRALIKRANSDTYVLEDQTSPIIVDFEALQSRNPDICGWLYCPSTVISYPVVQADDNSFYLHKDIDLNYSSYGTLFTEALSNRDFDNDNSIIYGHHMKDGGMFAGLVNYAKQGYYEKHPTLYLNTPEMNYRIELFAAFLTDMYSDVYTSEFQTDDEMQEWIDHALEQSAFRSETEVKPGDKCITFSTCTYEYDTARYVVLGKMIPIR